ncbi:hypothetical protein RO3G_03075 [Lichtheimia corymbifera JMRC:FSU:9682]|uniref:C2H2-type domain-containing protein n=1 Tax=Lichtheimia corymbifera JMRC:FSU:9682 TaxID=1263082 RepID=A0A068RJK8_9FUNG|nr:hypothetical protein RO3G_03075 [Lichtheimia corymbifera JMRC:FSU:9682]
MESHHSSMDSPFIDPSSMQQHHLPISDAMMYATPPHPATAYLSPISSNGRGSNITYSAAGGALYPEMSGTATSTPLTPTVSPTHYDAMQQQQQLINTARKYSVDVGPFGYMSHPRQQQFWMMQQDELMRRSSTATNISLDEQGGLSHPSVPTPPSDYTSSGDILQQQQQFAMMPPPPSSSISGDGTKKRHVKMTPPAAKSTDRPNVQHKHVCKYAFCGWSFKRYEHLKRHMLVHTGERPYQCRFPGCGKSFSRSDNFHAHCRTHTKKAMQQQQQQQQALGNTGNQKTAAAVNGAGDDHNGLATVSHALSTRTDDLPNGSAAFFEQRGDAATPLYEQHANSIIDPKPSFQPHNAAVVPQPTMTLNHETGFHHQHQPVMETTPLSSSAGSPFTTFSSSNITTTPGMLLHPFPFDMSTRLSAAQQQQPPIQLKSHMCPVPQCQRRFKRLEHLKRHMRIHTLERPFPCTFPNCNKAFSRSDNLSQHLKTHQRHEDRRKRQLQQQQQQHELVGTIHASGVDNSDMGWRNPNNDNVIATTTTTTTTITHHHPAITTTAATTNTASVGC